LAGSDFSNTLDKSKNTSPMLLLICPCMYTMKFLLSKNDFASFFLSTPTVFPEKDKEVLVKREKFGIEIAFLSYDGLWQERDEYIVFGDVTHWAYLPEPPKEV
jgi:hypothetical protein